MSDAVCTPHLLLHGVDSLYINVRSAGADGLPDHEPLPERISDQLDQWQEHARQEEMAVRIPLAFEGKPFFIQAYGGGQGRWRWLLSCESFELAISRGRLKGNILMQVRLSSAYLWTTDLWKVIVDVTAFLIEAFGLRLLFQPSRVDLCADLSGLDVGTYREQHLVFLSRGRRRPHRAERDDDGQPVLAVPDDVYSGPRLATIDFGSHGSPLSGSLYNKSLEIKQKSKKYWFHDLWKVNGWDGTAPVWRVEMRFTREALHEITNGDEQDDGTFHGIDDLFDLPDRLLDLWAYAVGRAMGDAQGNPDGWLRLVEPSVTDTNKARWPIHPFWLLVQQAFTDESCIIRDDALVPMVDELGMVQMVIPALLVRKRRREMHLRQLLLQVFGCLATASAWLGGYADGDTAPHVIPPYESIYDYHYILHWLHHRGIDAYVLPLVVKDHVEERTVFVTSEEGEDIPLLSQHVEENRRRALDGVFKGKVVAKQKQYGLAA